MNSMDSIKGKVLTLTRKDLMGFKKKRNKMKKKRERIIYPYMEHLAIDKLVFAKSLHYPLILK